MRRKFLVITWEEDQEYISHSLPVSELTCEGGVDVYNNECLSSGKEVGSIIYLNSEATVYNLTYVDKQHGYIAPLC